MRAVPQEAPTISDSFNNLGEKVVKAAVNTGVKALSRGSLPRWQFS